MLGFAPTLLDPLSASRTFSPASFFPIILRLVQVEVVESIAEEAENMDQHSDHEDVRSEHSDQDHDNPPVEHDDGETVISCTRSIQPRSRFAFLLNHSCNKRPLHLIYPNISTLQVQRQAVSRKFDSVFSVVGAESDMDLDLLAESESDSESEDSRDQDAVSVQRSAITTTATAGSEAGIATFSEDDSGDSSNQEEEESDAEASEEHDDTDDIGEKRRISHTHARANVME